MSATNSAATRHFTATFLLVLPKDADCPIRSLRLTGTWYAALRHGYRRRRRDAPSLARYVTVKVIAGSPLSSVLSPLSSVFCPSSSVLPDSGQRTDDKGQRMEDLRLRDKGVIEKTTYCGAGKTVSFLHISYDWSFFVPFGFFRALP